MKMIPRLFWNGFMIFYHKKVTLIAAAASFYIILSIVPLTLLILRVLGTFLGDVEQLSQQIFLLGQKFFPEAAPQMLDLLQEIIKGPLHAEARFTFINFIFLAWASLSFFHAVLKGIYLINGGKEKNLFRKFEGLILVGLSLFMVTISIVVPSLLKLIEYTIKNNFVVDGLRDVFPQIGGFLDYFYNLDLGITFLIQTNLLDFILFLIYFTFLYRWFFDWKIKTKEAIWGSLTFVLSLILGKNLFLVYIKYFRDNLLNNYGDYYTYILGMLWFFAIMCFFFFGACLCEAKKMKKRRLRWN